MRDHPQHPHGPKPDPDPDPSPGPGLGLDFSTATAPAPGTTLSVEAVIEQARTMRRGNADDLARRLGRGERLSAEQLYETLRNQTLATWWLLVDRHIHYARGARALAPEQTVARFVSWVSPYLEDDTVTPEVTQSVHILGPGLEHELALAHLERAMALIRRDAARTFLSQVKTLAPAPAPQTPSSTSTGQEKTA
ncbi:hypothetical protein ACIBEJ_30505 [Nonomuraea sp. NPDC050790]|uniref:hypothetical protein n=1 Tax=Nonomuraea sp. NPDC050790 TaxID=3364371 RepID=UPI0037914DE1